MSASAHILIVDDEPQIMRFLTHALLASGYNVTQATTAAEALESFKLQPIDVVILDLGLPDRNGKEVIEALRQISSVPIIVLSAHDQEMERIMALDLGANDFMPKPFGIGELLARLRVLLRKSALVYAGLRIDEAQREVCRDGLPVKLTRKEFDLTLLLAQNAGRVLPHKLLLEAIWGPAHRYDIPYLRVFIGQIRRKLSPNAEQNYIQTVSGVGYRWVLDGPVNR